MYFIGNLLASENNYLCICTRWFVYLVEAGGTTKEDDLCAVLSHKEIQENQIKQEKLHHCSVKFPFLFVASAKPVTYPSRTAHRPFAIITAQLPPKLLSNF